MNSPAIRFAGFTEDWEERKVGDYLTVSRIPGHTGLNARKLTVKLWGKGIVEKTDSYGGSGNTQYYIRSAGQFMYGKLDFLHAAFGIVPEAFDQYESTLDSPAFDMSRIDGLFLLNRVTQENFFLKYGMIANGSRKAKRIHEDTFLDMPLIVPCYEEQSYIGLIFKTLDSLITLHQREHDKTVNIKKALLEKMFPKDGEDKPAIRFAGFTGVWERREIGECFTERNERTGTGDLISVTMNSGVMRAEDLGRHDTSSNDKSNYKKVEVGDIAYNSMRMWQGASGYSPYSGILSPAYTVIIPQEGMHSPFFAYLFKRSNMIHQFQINSQGLTSDTWNLKWPFLRTIRVIIPEFEEQRRISEFFAEIDRLIALHQRELTKLQNIKKALLEKMFV